ncbi:MAG: hypothetical protein SGJ01_14520, partial [Gemmatimonadota bacterium]|nr:hypothetical protein [Gemmatimonadota bacterium]
MKEMQALWVPSILHPERRVAQPTLTALLRLLRLNRTEESGVPPSAGSCALQNAPTLGTVGGIARMEGPGGEAVVVA